MVGWSRQRPVVHRAHRRAAAPAQPERSGPTCRATRAMIRRRRSTLTSCSSANLNLAARCRPERAFYAHAVPQPEQRAHIRHGARRLQFRPAFQHQPLSRNDRIATPNPATLARRRGSSTRTIERLRVVVGQRFYYQDQRGVERIAARGVYIRRSSDSRPIHRGLVNHHPWHTTSTHRRRNEERRRSLHSRPGQGHQRHTHSRQFVDPTAPSRRSTSGTSRRSGRLRRNGPFWPLELPVLSV